jgi:hypothetical protein
MSDAMERVREEAARLVRERHDANPHDMVEALVATLDRGARRALLEHGAHEVLLEANRFLRMENRPRAGRSWKSEVTVGDFLSQRFYVAGEWRELGGCSVDDVLAIAAGYHDRAKRNAQLARDFEALAEAMRQTGAATVADYYRANGMAA